MLAKQALTLVLLTLSLIPVQNAAANQPMTLRLLVWEGYAPKAQREQFIQHINKNHDVDLTITVEHISKAEDVYTALRLKKADVVSPSHNRINDKRFKMIDSGLLLPIRIKNISNFSQLKPKFKSLPHLVKDDVHYGLPFAWGPYGLAYNPSRTSKPPNSWNALWQPEYAGLISAANYDEINVFITALALGYDILAPNLIDTLDTKLVVEKLAILIKHSRSLWVGVDNADDLEGLALAASWGFALPELRSRGEPWRWAYPAEGVPGWIDNHLIGQSLKNQPLLRHIAEQWINYTISSEFQQEVLVEVLGTIPVNQHVFDNVSLERRNGFYSKTFASKKTPIILMPELDRRTRNGIKMMWAEALLKAGSKP